MPETSNIRKPASMSDLANMLAVNISDIQKARNAIMTVGPSLGELIASAYEYAGDPQYLARGAEAQDELVAINEHVGQTMRRLIELTRITRRAADAVTAADNNRSNTIQV